MYFIQQGLVEIRKSGVENPIKQLADGSFFGGLCCNFFICLAENPTPRATPLEVFVSF